MEMTGHQGSVPEEQNTDPSPSFSAQGTTFTMCFSEQPEFNNKQGGDYALIRIF